MEVTARIEPAIAVLQTAALPLGDVTVIIYKALSHIGQGNSKVNFED